MKKMLTALVAAATIAGAAVATSAPAEARWGGGWHGGWRGGGWGWGLGGFAAGAIVGSALAAPYYYGGYGPYGITARPIRTMARPASGVRYGLAMLGRAPASEPHLNTSALLTVSNKSQAFPKWKRLACDWRKFSAPNFRQIVTA
jgi:hypothetical protein